MLPTAVRIDSIPVPDEAPSSELGEEEFLRMLIVQLENQDPLDPQDSSEFTAQLAQFSSLEQLTAMRASLDELAGIQSASKGLAGVELIGRQALIETSQFAIADPTATPTLAFELPAPDTVERVQIVDANGSVVAQTGPLGRLPAGLIELDWSQFDRVPGPGIYSFRVDQGLAPASPAVPLVQARVTGATLSGANPVVLMGDAVAPLSAVREVRE